MKRRLLLQSAAAAGFIPPLVRSAAAATENTTYDCIVVGSGAAGLSAAVSAAEHGARVLVLEKAATLGGHTILSTGYVSAVTRDKLSQSEFDAACAAMLAGMRSTAGRRGNIDLERKLVLESGDAIAWLADMGLTWEQNTFQTLAGLAPRSYISSVVRAGYDYVNTLNKRARDLGAKVQFSTRATDLTLDDKGRIKGLIATHEGASIEYFAPCVVLATGGYGGNVAMRSLYVPWMDATYPTTADPYFKGNDTSTGDGIEMGARIGADLVDMDCIMAIPFWGGRLTDYVGADIYVDATGRRFVNEGSSWKQISTQIRKLPNEECWVITDSQSLQGASRSSKIMNGVVKVANSVEEMASGMNVDKAVLKQTLDRYNGFVRNGVDKDFGKNMLAQEINKPPYFYGKERLYVHYCCGGLRIDEHARVLNTEGLPIAGLYGAGETTGGVHGEDRLGGCSITDCFVFGREAGRHGAKYALQIREELT